MSVIDRLRQPEYTGENRCIPCTAVNVAISVSISILAAIVSPVLGAGVFMLSLGSIYLRGFLVPGTPTLTKRYFPERVLRWFDKDSTTPIDNENITVDPEQVLLNADAVEPCQEDIDLCLTSDFQQAWRKRIHTIRSHNFDGDQLVGALDISTTDDRYTLDRHGDGFVARTDEIIIGQWSSQAAVIADVAAAAELGDRLSDWLTLAPAEIARVLRGLRIFIEKCPDCDGPVQVDQEVVGSCCRSYDVIAATCQECDSRLFEMEWNNIDMDKSHSQPNQSTQTSV